MEDLIFPSKIGNKDLKKESRGGLISKGEGLKAKAVVPECDTFSRDPKTSWCKSKNVHSIARSFNSPSRFYSFSSASQPPTRPKLHLFEIEGAYSPLFFLRLCFLSFSLSLSRRFFSSSFLEAPLQGGNRKRIAAPNFTAHGWNLWGLFFVPSTVISSFRWRSSLSLAS